MKTNLSALVFFCLFASIILVLQPTASQSLPKKSQGHEVSLDSAKKYIANLKKDATQMKTKGGMFYRDVFEKMLTQKGMVGIRYYYAKMDDGTPTIVLVGVDSVGKDMTNAVIAEKTYPCPPYCDTETVIDK